MIKGHTPRTEDNACQKWLDSKLLSAGIDDAPTGLGLHKKEFLDELINLPAEGESEARTLATYMHRHVISKKPLATIGGDSGTYPCVGPLSVSPLASVDTGCGCSGQS